jgi:exodeoxyribonuclease VII large subunit
LQDVAVKRRRLEELRSRLARNSPAARLPAEREALLRRRGALVAATRALLARHRARLAATQAQLGALSPLRTLERGYSITLDERTGAVVTSTAGLAAGVRLRTLLHQGQAVSEVVAVDRADPGSDGSTT